MNDDDRFAARLAALLADRDCPAETLLAVVSDPNTPPDELRQATAHRNADGSTLAAAIHEAARRNSSPSGIWTVETAVRRAAAEHPNLTADVARQLFADDRGWVVSTLARHPNTPDDVLVAMVADGPPADVLVGIVERDELSAAVFDALSAAQLPERVGATLLDRDDVPDHIQVAVALTVVDDDPGDDVPF